MAPILAVLACCLTIAICARTRASVGDGSPVRPGFIDRTSEFHGIVEKLSSEGLIPKSAGTVSGAGSSELTGSSELNVMSARIAEEIQEARLKTQELRKLAKKKSIFQDETHDVQKITYDLNGDIKALESKLEAFAQKAKRIGMESSSAQLRTHTTNMVSTLSGRLLEVTGEFKDALEERSKTLEKQQKRRELYAGDRGVAVQRRPIPTSYTGDPDDPEAGTSSSSLDGRRQSVAYKVDRSREQAIHTAQKTIGELAQMFQKMATLVVEQESVIHRIDDDVEKAVTDVEDGNVDLLSYLNHMSSNRGLIIKVFLVLIFLMLSHHTMLR